MRTERRAGDPLEGGRNRLRWPQPLIRAEPADLGHQPHQRLDHGLGGRIGVGGHRCRPVRHHHRVAAGQRRPQLVGDERHQRMDQPEQLVEHVPEDAAGQVRRGLVGAVQRRLGQLQVPVAELIPGEVVQDLADLRELELLEQRVRLGYHGGQPGQDPPVRDAEPGPVRRGQRDLVPVARRGAGVHAVDEREPGRVPELVAEIARPGHPFLAERHVAARARAPGQREAGRVSPEPGDPVERVDGVSARLGHLLALRVPDQAVQRDLTERHGSVRPGVGHRVQAEHHHPGDPEEQDVVPGDQHAGRIERAQVGRIVRPAKRRERPQRRGEPGIKNVRILSPLSSARLTGPWWFLVRPDAADLAVGRVPDRDPMAPPELPADAPVVHVVDPVEVARGQLRRVHPHPSVPNGVPRRLGQRPDLDEPLQGQPRLDGGSAAATVADRVQIRSFFFDNAALSPQCRKHGRPGFEPVETFEGAARGDDAALVHDRQAGQVVPAADLEVVGIVRRCHLHRAGAELGIDVRIGHDRDLAAGQRQLDRLANKVGVARVVRMHSDGGVAEHRFNPRGGHDHGRVAVAVPDADQLAFVVGVVHLDVRQRGHAARAPVDDAVSPVDQPVVIEPLEDGLDRAGQALVHGEPLTGPVNAVTEAAHLAEDLATVGGLPLPHPLHEGLAA